MKATLQQYSDLNAGNCVLNGKKQLGKIYNITCEKDKTKPPIKAKCTSYFGYGNNFSSSFVKV